jgi:hypothetical protein
VNTTITNVGAASVATAEGVSLQPATSGILVTGAHQARLAAPAVATSGVVLQPSVPYVPGDRIATETWRPARVGSGYAPDGGNIAGNVVTAEPVTAHGCSSRWQRVTVAPVPLTKAAAVAALEKASEAIREARQASGKSAVCTAAQWARFEAASASAIVEIAFLLNVIAPNAPVYSHFTADPAEFDLMTAR